MGSIKVPAAVTYAHKVANYAHEIAICPVIVFAPICTTCEK